MLRSAGKVVNFTRKGSLILRAKDAPRIGDFIVDKRSNRIGKVIRITGPVKSPYVMVTNNVEDTEILKTLPGRELFISERKERPRQQRPRGGDRGRRPVQGDRNRQSKKYDSGKKGNFSRKPPSHGKGKGRSSGGHRKDRSRR